MCLAIGHPVNTKEVELSIDKLSVLFEVLDLNDIFIETYEEELIKIMNPSIIQPKKSKIISN